MFKKPFSTGQSNIVGGTERKKLRRTLEKQFPGLDDSGLEVMLCRNTHLHTRVHAYMRVP